MRTIEELHEAAQKVVVNLSPKAAIQVFAGELAAVIHATTDIVRALPVEDAARIAHGHYGHATNHQADVPLKISASKLLSLTKLLQSEMVALPPE